MRGQSVQLDLQLTCMFQLFSTVARGRWGSWALQVMTSPSSSSLAVIHRELTVTLPSGLVCKVDIRCEEGQSVRFVESRYWNHLRSLEIITSWITWGLPTPEVILVPPLHQDMEGGGLAPTASQRTSWGCPAERDWDTPSRRREEGPTENMRLSIEGRGEK